MQSVLYFVILLAPWAARGAVASPKIVIVGAGASGIAAATKLLEHGFNDILVLEAESRIGGRIFSTDFFGGTVDLGAQWCHGNEGNIVYEMTKDLGLLNNREVVNDYYYSDGKGINMKAITALNSLLDKILQDAFGTEEMSVGELVKSRYTQRIMEMFKGYSDKIQFALEYLETYMRNYLIGEGAFSWYSLPTNSNYTELEGNYYNEWKMGGYRAFLNVLMKKFPDPKEHLSLDNRILFYKEVTRIVWDNKLHRDQKAIVFCSDGSSYLADHVIFTPSVGVLKHTYKSMFVPSLPKAKITAIKTLGLNATLKVYLHFPKRWWSTSNFTDINFIWSKEDEAGLAERFPEGPKKKGRPWLLNLARLSVVDVYNPNTLLVWFSGELVPEIELLPDRLMENGIMYVINKFLHKKFPGVGWPDGILRNIWFGNPHFRGTYSFETVASRKTGVSQALQLAEPLFSGKGNMTLLFAGEATHPNYYSNVHGATETGFREAQRIIKLYK